MSTETPANVVKGSTSPKAKKSNGAPRMYVSDKGTPPLNDVPFFNEKTREWDVRKGLTEEQKVAEGYNAPLAYQGAKLRDEAGNVLPGGGTVGRFQLTDTDREALKAVHTHRKHTGLSERRPSKKERGATLIVHLKNLRRKADFKDFKKLLDAKGNLVTTPSGFKTTYAFPDVKPSEINNVISTVVRLNKYDPKDVIANYINFYYYNGQKYYGNGQRKEY